MRLFIKHCILFFVGVITLFSLGFILPDNNPVQSNDYAIIDKHILLEQSESPKIILVGGSNVSFGFNSEKIAETFSIPVVNSAIHAGYGLKYIIDDVKPYIKKGDIIILSPEYSHFYGDNYLGKEPLLFSLYIKPGNVKYLSFKQGLNLLGYVPKYSLQKIKALTAGIIKKNRQVSGSNFVYQRDSNNRYGDVTAHWGLPKTNFEPYPINGRYNKDAISYIIEFNNYIEQKEATLIISYPSLSQSSFEINKEQIKYVEKVLENSKLNILGSPEDFSYEDNFYYNTPYHLGEKGANIRTDSHITYLNETLGK